MAQRPLSSMIALLTVLPVGPVQAEIAPRQMERLGRGVVAAPVEADAVYVGWGLLGTEPQDLRFNVYRQSDNDRPIRLNPEPLQGGTHLIDRRVDLSQINRYLVRPVIHGVEGSEEGVYVLPAHAPSQPCLAIPLQPLADHYVHLAWVGDLDGDGEYDFVVDHLPPTQGPTQKVEAYRRDGTFLWRVDMGHNSVDQARQGNASAVISNGMNDGLTVYDLDMDGQAEVILKAANGVTFGAGSQLQHSDDLTQFICVLDYYLGHGMTPPRRPNITTRINSTDSLP